MSDDPNSAGTAREVDLSPFKKRVQVYLGTLSPGSGNRSGADVAGKLHYWLQTNVDDRLDLLERERVALQKENAELRADLKKLAESSTLTPADAHTPLDEDLDHRYLRVIKEGEAARDTGKGSPYPGNTLEHVLHSIGWVKRDLYLALHDVHGQVDEADEAPLKPWKPTDTEAFAERLAAVEDRLNANVDNTVQAHKSIDALSNRIAYVEGALQHHASLIAGLQRATGVGATVAGPADEAAKPEFPDPVPAEELVLERGSIVHIRKGAHTGLANLDHKRVWEVVGFFSPEGEPSMVQLGLYPWNSESPRPMHWVKLDDIVGLAE